MMYNIIINTYRASGLLVAYANPMGFFIQKEALKAPLLFVYAPWQFLYFFPEPQ